LPGFYIQKGILDDVFMGVYPGGCWYQGLALQRVFTLSAAIEVSMEPAVEMLCQAAL